MEPTHAARTRAHNTHARTHPLRSTSVSMPSACAQRGRERPHAEMPQRGASSVVSEARVAWMSGTRASRPWSPIGLAPRSSRASPYDCEREGSAKGEGWCLGTWEGGKAAAG